MQQYIRNICNAVIDLSWSNSVTELPIKMRIASSTCKMLGDICFDTGSIWPQTHKFSFQNALLFVAEASAFKQITSERQSV